jgi:tetratricopeptide (TPR) repeat protein
VTAERNDYLSEWMHLALQQQAGIQAWQETFDGACVSWQLDRAQRLLREAKRTALTDRERATVYHGEGMHHAQLGDWSRAVDCMMAAVDLLEETEFVEDGILLLNDLGMVLRLQGNAAGADAAHQQALSLAREIEQPFLIADALEQIGLDKMHQKAFAVALDFFQEALSQREALGDRNGLVRTLNHLGDLRRQIGDLGAAREALERSRMLLVESDDAVYVAAQITANLGNVHFEEGALAEAEDCWRSALATFDALGAIFDRIAILNNLGGLAFQRHAYETALDYYGQSLALAYDLGDQRGLEAAMTNFALVLEAGKKQNAD